MIRTNNHYRQVITGAEILANPSLTNRKKQELLYEYDYVQDFENAAFFWYKGEYIFLGDFVSIPVAYAPAIQKRLGLENWDGIKTESAWTGLLVRMDRQCEYVQVAYYYE